MGPLMATENRRQTLLREMGIESWFSRSVLPGAGLSHAIDWEADIGKQPLSDAAAPRAAASPEPAAPGGQIPASVRAVLVRDPAPAAAPTDSRPLAPAGEQPLKIEPPTSVQPSTLADTPALEFGFSWFNVDERLSVLAMLPSGADRLNSACRQMLQRILLALIPGLKDTDRQEHTFHWPFPGDLGLPAGQQAARQAVDGFVARRLREQPSSMVLILADETPPFLYNNSAANGEEAAGELFAHRQLGFAMLCTHSLHAMEADGKLKRSAWQAMQALRERLNRNVE